jgi:hypothetical protein
MGIFVEKHYGKQPAWFALLVKAAIAVSGAFSFLRRIFTHPPSAGKNKTIHTLIAGAAPETASAAAILANDKTVKRNITTAKDIRETADLIQETRPNEIIFCAGTIAYKEIIECMEGLESDAAYKFFAAAGGSIAGSMNKDNSGETVAMS